MPSQSPQAAFPELYESFSDGRLTNVFYRREQLARLRQTLVESRQTILAAIVEDAPGITPAEAFVELYMTIAAIKQHHDSLKPSAERAEEYSIANGQDAPDSRGGVGVVAIVPQSHSLLYSVIIPLSAAIAAGNCVAVVLEKTLQTLPRLLETAIRASLDPDIFAIVPFGKIADVSGDGYIPVVQTGDSTFHDRPHALISHSTALSIAVVDRTADLETAAKALVNARMQFGGRSPYAPDVVLVNEFVKTDFVQAVVKHAIRYMAELNSGIYADSESKAIDRKPLPAQGKQPPKGIKIVTSGSNVSILDVIDRTSLAPIGKVLEPTLYIHAIRSLDDAIEVANDLTHGNAAAAFVFGDLPMCKYLLQFVGAQVGLANHFPRELLVGPVAPRGKQPVNLAIRYPTDLFSVTQPRFVHKTDLSRQVDRLLDSAPAAARAQEQSILLKDLGLEDRAPVRHIEGYFESAALVGLATIATPVLTGVGYLAVVGVRKVLAVAWRK
ncbi:aldehyde dehydrogenase [Ophiostoma piceae UAMH 11346]|uniref:Aldehyde dehydrogenase n=1 Tax=Ophiostoma piceae (strain UAMH 11346) TaxID=1262450 RepID=S3BRW1_OPHP1|nr:aldehyde dehydrogenase [Ophiostoma piceae UAMH 11346]